MRRIFSIIGILLFLFSCRSTYITRNTEFKLIDKSNNLYAFIGEKISVTEFDPNTNNKQKIIDQITGDTIILENYVMDKGFICKYKVLRNVFNELKTDTVEFKAYDHYGRPGFENYENVLLYISNSSDSSHYFHQKYLYDPVKKINNGIWEGLNGESIQTIFNSKDGVLKTRGLFK